MTDKKTVLVSSTVYGHEELLERVYSILTVLNFEVWMSHKGTLPVSSSKTAFENCLYAVDKCDIFLGIITPNYGSGKVGTDLSITHKEIKKAVELKKNRYFLAHDNVVYARKLLSDLGFKNTQERDELSLKKGATSLDDIRVIDMYEDAIRDQLPLDEREGNWVQKYSTTNEADLFVMSQFSRYQEAEEFIKENLNSFNGVSDE